MIGMRKMSGSPAYDVEALRRDFPALSQQIGQHALAYLDNASTTQKPRAVLDAMVTAYETSCANVHRGVHTLSSRATEAYEASRARMARFLDAEQPEEIVFVRGTTEAINLVAATYGRSALSPGDRVLVTGLEHHSNLVPWQMLCEDTGAHLDVVPLDMQGGLRMGQLSELLTERTKIVASGYISNSLGTVVPVREFIAAAKRVGAVTVIDGAQAAPHMKVSVRELGCDFYAFSGHKTYGPMGIGVLYGRRECLEEMPPWQGGGEMISEVDYGSSTHADVPQKFEAGTPNVVGAIGLAAALDYLEGVGIEAVQMHEAALLEHARDELAKVPGLRLFGSVRPRAAVVSFTLDGAHPHDVGTVLDTEGIAVRAGHHCTQPVMDHFGVMATVRASFGMYNTHAEVERLVAAVQQARGVLGL